MDYYSVDAILAEEDKLKVKLPKDVNNFAFYHGPGQEILKKDTKVDLPFFLIKFLIQNEYCTIIEHPVDAIKNDLDACSHIVNLKNKHFYEVGRFITDRKYLAQVFFERIGSFINILPKEDFSEDDLCNLSYEEKKIILKSRKQYSEFQNFYFNKEKDRL